MRRKRHINAWPVYSDLRQEKALGSIDAYISPILEARLRLWLVADRPTAQLRGHIWDAAYMRVMLASLATLLLPGDYPDQGFDLYANQW